MGSRSPPSPTPTRARSEEHTSELQSLRHLVCRLLLEKKKTRPARTKYGDQTHKKSSIVTFCMAALSLVHASMGGAAWSPPLLFVFCFFFNDTATTEIYTLSLHDALPISQDHRADAGRRRAPGRAQGARHRDRKSTRLNSSHLGISYAVFCLKKKKRK